jgi:hypothetical protein
MSTDYIVKVKLSSSTIMYGEGDKIAYATALFDEREVTLYADSLFEWELPQRSIIMPDEHKIIIERITEYLESKGREVDIEYNQTIIHE